MRRTKIDRSMPWGGEDDMALLPAARGLPRLREAPWRFDTSGGGILVWEFRRLPLSLSRPPSPGPLSLTSNSSSSCKTAVNFQVVYAAKLHKNSSSAKREGYCSFSLGPDETALSPGRRLPAGRCRGYERVLRSSQDAHEVSAGIVAFPDVRERAGASRVHLNEAVVPWGYPLV